jgi:hypothetical protein
VSLVFSSPSSLHAQTDCAGRATQTFITALVTNLIIGGAELLVFILIKKRFRKIYGTFDTLLLLRSRRSCNSTGFCNF